tara:strand:- start:310 stop:483 length:174 start_codon:yes stop_codon:yes gene_type:complete
MVKKMIDWVLTKIEKITSRISLWSFNKKVHRKYYKKRRKRSWLDDLANNTPNSGMFK